jgi:hypothetical protein
MCSWHNAGGGLGMGEKRIDVYRNKYNWRTYLDNVRKQVHDIDRAVYHVESELKVSDNVQALSVNQLHLHDAAGGGREGHAHGHIETSDTIYYELSRGPSLGRGPGKGDAEGKTRRVSPQEEIFGIDKQLSQGSSQLDLDLNSASATYDLSLQRLKEEIDRLVVRKVGALAHGVTGSRAQ